MHAAPAIEDPTGGTAELEAELLHTPGPTGLPAHAAEGVPAWPVPAFYSREGGGLEQPDPLRGLCKTAPAMRAQVSISGVFSTTTSRWGCMTSSVVTKLPEM